MTKRVKKIKIKATKAQKTKVDLLAQLTKEQIMKAVNLINGDGHTIFKESALIENCGWPTDTARSVCEELESDQSSYKGTIIGHNGEIVEKCFGWYGLSLLYSLASVLKVEYEGCLGRGYQARAIDKAIREHFEQKQSLAHQVIVGIAEPAGS